ncbi:hypothetical protein CcCBS67573_g06229 [Chytriomyces confervae]|uniref:NLE domain-containing protein n=1 Tax=Chytriomyces confervae TaxID=246404 RepID=A0A507F6K7_9FUNG|nr:hypothetical protein CcCBS67573_g06229 [Chytriomyces confervae]
MKHRMDDEPAPQALTPGERYVKPRIKKQLDKAARDAALADIDPDRKIVAQLKSDEDDSVLGPLLNLPVGSTIQQLAEIVNQLLQNEDPLPYAFFVDSKELSSTIHEDIIVNQGKSSEEMITITYRPQAVFKVRTVTRCSSSLNGHTEAVLIVSFSPDGSMLATGSGDTTIRIWDLNTETPRHTLQGHTNWVQMLAWSPDAKMLTSGSMDKTIRIWNPKTGKAMGDALKSHTQLITGLAWEPLHLNAQCNRFASSSKDQSIKIWNAITRQVIITMTSHTAPVTCIKWGGSGLLYSASRDKTVRVWDSKDGKLVRVLEGHGHWVNSLAVSSEFLVRTGGWDHTSKKFADAEEAHQAAVERYNTNKGIGPERLASCSDDFTIFLWTPETSKKPIARMTGHMQLVNHISFSPDGRTLASASFDKSVKLWDGFTGKFIDTLRGHVGAVYQVTFSSDSRQVLSGSRDSTLKVWDLKTRKLKMDLPGHADEVFSVDWSPGGDKVASGGKDRVVKM